MLPRPEGNNPGDSEIRSLTKSSDSGESAVHVTIGCTVLARSTTVMMRSAQSFVTRLRLNVRHDAIEA